MAFSRTKRIRTSRPARPRLEPLEDRSVPATAYLATDLVANEPGVGRLTDPKLIDAWGISLSPNGGAFWLSAAGAGISPLYTGDVAGSPVGRPFEVAIPGGLPTGQVWNGTTDFRISAGAASAVPPFIFASLTGAVTAWSNAVPAPGSRVAQTAFQATDGAVYTGMALANNGAGNFLYLADFANGEIDVLNSTYQQVDLAGSFTDPALPDGFVPFNVAAIGGKMYVTYARQDRAAPGSGFVSVFDTNGNFLQRLVSRGRLDSPWALVQAPANFGDFSNALLVGNHGNGRVLVYDISDGRFLGTLNERPGRPLVVEGLWALAFGNGKTAGNANTLYYAAGPDGGEDGVFGGITANAAGTNPVSAALAGGNLVVQGSRNSDIVFVDLDRTGANVVVRAGGQLIGTFPLAGLGSIRVNGYAGDDIVTVGSGLDVITVLDGGAGNDILTGGAAGDVLLGGTGTDLLFGGLGRDVLIGGAGSDALFGGGGDDLLIGGTTGFDADAASLLLIRGAWNSADAYATRVANLRNGVGAPRLDATTVSDDAAADLLIGGAGQDWYFAKLPDILLGLAPGEEIN